jgi:hypothetical protein
MTDNPFKVQIRISQANQHMVVRALVFNSLLRIAFATLQVCNKYREERLRVLLHGLSDDLM